MTYQMLIGASIVALAIAVSQTIRLHRDAPQREVNLWRGIFLLLCLGLLQRLVLGIRVAFFGLSAPTVGLLVTLLVSPLALVVVLSAIGPSLRTYRAADQRRQLSDQMFLRSLAASPDPEMILSEHGRLDFLNVAASSFLRYPRSGLVGSAFLDFIHGADPQPTQEFMAPEGASLIEFVFVRGDGSHASLECQFIALGDGRHLVVGRDPSSRLQAEADRSHTDRLRAIEAMAGTVGDDIRRTLSFIHSSLELSQELGVTKVTLDAPLRATTEALGLLDQFVRASLPQDEAELPETHAINLTAVLEQVVSHHGHTVPDSVRVDLHTDDPKALVRMTQADAEWICQGLLHNALQLLPPRRLAPSTVDARIRRIEPGVDRRVAQVEIDVSHPASDGLAAETRAHTFEPFGPSSEDPAERFTLSMVHAVVLRYGGSMTTVAASARTRTIVRLPAACEPDETVPSG